MIKNTLATLIGNFDLQAKDRAHPGRSFRKWGNIIFSLLVSVGCVYWVLREIELHRLLQEVRTVKPLFFIAALCLGGLSCWVRALRWKVLLSGQALVKTGVVFTSLMIGYLANNLLPARMGELVRVYVLERRTGLSKSGALASIVLERVADVLVLLLFIGVAAAFIQLPALLVSGIWIALIGVLGVIVTLAFLSKQRRTTLWLEASCDRLPRYGQKLKAVLSSFSVGLKTMHQGREVSMILVLTFVIWGMEMGMAWMVAISLDLSLSWVAPMLIIAVIGISSILPAAPGAIGTYEFFTLVALKPFAVEETKAVALAFLLHICGYLVVSTLGMLSVWAESDANKRKVSAPILESVNAS